MPRRVSSPHCAESRVMVNNQQHTINNFIHMNMYNIFSVDNCIGPHFKSAPFKILNSCSSEIWNLDKKHSSL